MPRDGDTPLARFVRAVVDDDGFSLGPPQPAADGATVTVPVLRTAARPRSYVLAVERADDMSAVDTGRIDRLRVHNESDVTVFIPAGAIFEGRTTTSRATVAGVLIAPSDTREVEVKCVQAARPVVGGESLSLARDLAPLGLTQALLSRDQGLVWAAVDERAAQETPDPRGVPPAMGSACGQILLDARGVVAVEIFDHPDAWAASGPRGRAPSAPNPLGLSPANAGNVARRFLGALASAALRPAGSSSWVAQDLSVEFTVVKGTVIHLLAFGGDLTSVPLHGDGETSSGRASAGSRDFIADSLPVAGGAEGGAVAVSRTQVDSLDPFMPSPDGHPRRRKVLTSGWDSATFASLERLSRKEFRGDRSAAIRALVRRGLRDGGYLGPRVHAAPAADESEETPFEPDEARAALEARILAYERVAGTEAYADWLRKRARLEAERLREGRPEGLPDDIPPEATAPPPSPVIAEELPEPQEMEPETPFIPLPPPVDVRPLLRRAFAASAGGHYPEALTLFDEVLTAEPDNRTALLGRAVALRRSGKAQEALDALDAVLRAEPTNAAALLSRGRLLQERGDFQGALAAFDLLSTVAPNDWDVWLVRGDVLAKLGRRPEALHAYAEALRRNPDDESLKLRMKSLETMEAAIAPPPTPQIPLPRDVQEGQSYLVRESRPNLSLRVLRALGARGVPSLALTVRSPEALRRDIGIAGVRIIELSHTPGEGRADPTALAALTRLVERFIQEGRGHGVIAMDGLAQLVLENGSRETLLFVERVNEAVLQSHAVFLISIAPGDISDREVALLERSLRTLS